MTRTEFTAKISVLLFNMVQEGEHPIIDYALRSQEEQHRLWQIGRDTDGNKIGHTITNCDGFQVLSAHQSGKAVDILFIEEGKVVAPKKGWTYWHDKWVSAGGGREIDWDEDHFEG